MDRWLQAALDYIPSYLDYQVRMQHHPGCVVAVAHRNKVIIEHAFGFANLASGEPMTPRHRFRVASHSKSFTAAGVMKLREQHKVHLDARAGDYVKGLHAKSAQARIGQLLSHSAGFVRDGLDSGYFLDRRPFFNERELLADLREPAAVDRSRAHASSIRTMATACSGRSSRQSPASLTTTGSGARSSMRLA